MFRSCWATCAQNNNKNAFYLSFMVAFPPTRNDMTIHKSISRTISVLWVFVLSVVFVRWNFLFIWWLWVARCRNREIPFSFRWSNLFVIHNAVWCLFGLIFIFILIILCMLCLSRYNLYPYRSVFCFVGCLSPVICVWGGDGEREQIFAVDIFITLWTMKVDNLWAKLISSMTFYLE